MSTERAFTWEQVEELMTQSFNEGWRESKRWPNHKTSPDLVFEWSADRSTFRVRIESPK